MKKLFLKTLFLTVIIFAPISVIAGVSVRVNIPLPPPIIFPAPPELVIIPETDVYVVPDVADDIFFYAGWWWRPWQGRWYRSRYYDRGWVYYRLTPGFHSHIPSSWRNDYRNHHWKGYYWEHKRIPHHKLRHNWNKWKRERHWEKQSWGIKGMKHKRPVRHIKRKVHKSKTVTRERGSIDHRP
ncbi:MAG: hypothetical protein JW976_02500 [Syntrophaceae bacterium]|nr:hypothetical protein [Syntrophaceae bacterium]